MSTFLNDNMIDKNELFIFKYCKINVVKSVCSLFMSYFPYSEQLNRNCDIKLKPGQR